MPRRAIIAVRLDDDISGGIIRIGVHGVRTDEVQRGWKAHIDDLQAFDYAAEFHRKIGLRRVHGGD